MVDTCNSHGAGLSLAPNCSRAEEGMFSTTDYVTTCKAKLQIRSTRMECSDMSTKAQVFKIDLKDYKLRKTIDTLELSNYGGSSVTVDLTQDYNIGAFINNRDSNELNLTVFGDSCNHMSTSLKVDKLCDKDRLTRNAVVTCYAKLSIFQTEMFCGDTDLVPRVATVKLDKTQVDPMASTLVLDYQGSEVEVELK